MFKIYLKRSCGPSTDYAGLFATVEAAQARFAEGAKYRDGTPVPGGLGLPASCYYIADTLKTVRYPVSETLKERRNRLQRARRTSPTAKAKEALASRRSYWRRAFREAEYRSEREQLAHDKAEALGTSGFTRG